MGFGSDWETVHKDIKEDLDENYLEDGSLNPLSENFHHSSPGVDKLFDEVLGGLGLRDGDKYKNPAFGPPQSGYDNFDWRNFASYYIGKDTVANIEDHSYFNNPWLISELQDAANSHDKGVKHGGWHNTTTGQSNRANRRFNTLVDRQGLPSLSDFASVADAYKFMGTIDPTIVQGAITENQASNYVFGAAPLEDKLLNRSKQGFDVEGARHGSLKADRRARRNRNVRESRNNVFLTDSRKQARKKEDLQNSQLGMLTAANSGIQQHNERQDANRRQFLDIGRGLSGDSLTGLNDAAALQYGRDQTAAANQAAKDQQNMQYAGAALTALAMFI